MRQTKRGNEQKRISVFTGKMLDSLFFYRVNASIGEEKFETRKSSTMLFADLLEGQPLCKKILPCNPVSLISVPSYSPPLRVGRFTRLDELRRFAFRRNDNAIGPTLSWNRYRHRIPPTAGGESACTEGVNCDSYNLTLSGTPADWTGKQVHVQINWLSPSDDYDMYVHKGSLSGPVVASSGAGGTTQEQVDLNPRARASGRAPSSFTLFISRPRRRPI